MSEGRLNRKKQGQNQGGRGVRTDEGNCVYRNGTVKGRFHLSECISIRTSKQSTKNGVSRF